MECSCLLCLAARATALGDRRGPRITKDFDVVPGDGPVLSRRGLFALAGAAGAAALVAPATAEAATPATPRSASPTAPEPRTRPQDQAQAQARGQQARRQPAARGGVRRLWITNIHTGESFNGVYWQGGRHVPAGLRQLNVLLRDHRSGAIARIDPRLFDLLSQMQARLRLREPFQIVSGFRSPETNFQLYMQSSGVAENSFHTRGMAVDITTRSRSSGQLVRVARGIRYGGVGSYRGQRYIHVDTGPVRTWVY